MQLSILARQPRSCFGAGSLGWALDSGWSLLPWPPLAEAYNALGCTSLIYAI